MSESCYVMIKPGFVKKEIIDHIVDVMEEEDIYLTSRSLIQYDEETARLHYIEKQNKPYFNELVEYLTSDVAYGMIFEGEDAVTRCRNIVETLRGTLKNQYNLQTDVMRNIIHCSSRTKVGYNFLELDTQREIALFYYLRKQYIKKNKK